MTTITSRTYEPRAVIRELEFMNSTDTFFHASKAWATKRGGLRDQLKIFDACSSSESMKAWATRTLSFFAGIETWIDSYETNFIREYIADIQKTGWSDDYCEHAIKAAHNVSRQITTVHQWLVMIASETTRIQYNASVKDDPHPDGVNKLYIGWTRKALCEIEEYSKLVDTYSDDITIFQMSYPTST
jgi:hypothetical protein